MTISVIIPTFNEAAIIGKLINHLWEVQTGVVSEIIVSDGGSDDGTKEKATGAGAVFLQCPENGRGAQLNHGAAKATGDILYFLHADAFPPKFYDQDILECVANGYGFGNFRQHIQAKNPLVKINSWASRFDRLISSGGDQSLFITSELFRKLEGYRSDFQLMEDYDLFFRAKHEARGRKISRSLQVEDRKYAYNSFLKVNICNGVVFSLYQLGVHPNLLKPLYKKWINGPRYRSLPQ